MGDALFLKEKSSESARQMKLCSLRDLVINSDNPEDFDIVIDIFQSFNEISALFIGPLTTGRIHLKPKWIRN